MPNVSKNQQRVRTTEIVAAFVANNSVSVAAIPELIRSVAGVLDTLGQKADPAASAPDFRPAVSLRKSLADPNHILSMIDGKPYRMLKRHIGGHGLTPAQYRERFKLPPDYPMVAPAYSTKRSEQAKAIGLGRKPGEKPGSRKAKAQAAGVPAAKAIVRVAAPSFAKVSMTPTAAKASSAKTASSNPAATKSVAKASKSA